MNHSFNVNIAERFGIEEAIIIELIYWWIHKNECEEEQTMYHNDKMWCRCSAKGFNKFIPYMKPRNIARVLRELENEHGAITSDNFNTKATNQTKWYTFTDDFKKILKEVGYECSKMNNGMFKNEHSYKDNNINENKKKVSKDTQKEKTRFIKPSIEEIDAYIKERGFHFDAERFFDHYESVDWMRGKNKLKDWKAACRYWEHGNKKKEYEPLSTDEDKVKRFKLWMREKHSGIEFCEKPLTFDGYMRLQREYGMDEVCNQLDYIDANIGKFKKCDIELVIKQYLDKQ